MKKNFTKFLFSNLLLGSTMMLPLTMQAQYTISFMATGKYTAFEQVKVHNLTRNAVRTIGPDDWVLLSAGVVGVDQAQAKNETTLKVYPNPTNDVSYLAFTNPTKGKVQIQVTNVMGVSMVSYNQNAEAGKQLFSLSGLSTGNYAVAVSGEGFNYRQLLTVSNHSSASSPSIKLVSSDVAPATTPTATTQPSPYLKAGMGAGQEVLMPFVAGDTLQYSGYANGLWTGTYTHVPNDDKLVTLTFLHSVSFTGNTVFIHPVNNGSVAWTVTGNKLTEASYATDGRANTARAVYAHTAQAAAAYRCDTLTAYEFTDWYLPAKTELNYFYQNKDAIGNFTAGNYWSSTEQDLNTANYQSFVDGTQATATKNTTYNVRCVRRNVYSLAIVTTDSINNNKAQLNGTITDDAKSGVIERGFYISLQSNPSVKDMVVKAGGGSGKFSISYLSIGIDTTKSYYYVAYAKNGQQQISTGIVRHFTPRDYISGKLLDVDNNIYRITTIGNQTWMAENLKVTKYSNGTPIPLVTDSAEWGKLGANDTDKAYCWYNNDLVTYKDMYGALYTYAAATNGVNSGINVQGVCPTGWHLPSDAEWTTLADSLGGKNVAGSKLKATYGWSSGVIGTDSIGFTALPGNMRFYNGSFYTNMGLYGLWWTSTQQNAGWAFHRRLDYDSAIFQGGKSYVKSEGYSVRCVKN